MNYAASSISNKLDTYKKPLLFFFFSVILLVGISIHRDYGVSADEGISRYNAIVTAKYVIGLFKPDFGKADSTYTHISSLYQWKDKDYGVAFELPVWTLEKLLRLEDVRDIHVLHHLCIFLVFWVSILFFYLLVKERYQSWKMGLLGAALLVLSPRIFADAFYNSKDLVFMSFFIIGIYT
ncbi:MAG TPA: hypothetical protein VM884_04425, partial [Flavisolibacter sp.]|nr:hypothetical protein [Flavisolibacter sp.]